MFGTHKQISTLVLISLILAGCGSNAAKFPTPDTNAIRTEAVNTYIAGKTETASAAPAMTFTPPVLPTSTSTPPTTGTVTTIQPISACYKLLYKKDITIPDNTVMLPNEKFTKSWSVQNNGDCAWAPGFTFGLVGGDTMSGKNYVLTDPVPVGSVIQISIDMVAPSDKTGTIQGTWRMADANGTHFGDALTVVILIGGATTSTPPPPTATKSP